MFHIETFTFVQVEAAGAVVSYAIDRITPGLLRSW
jgi:hypothetical protein